jgi:hypothetical protein
MAILSTFFFLMIKNDLKKLFCIQKSRVNGTPVQSQDFGIPPSSQAWSKLHEAFGTNLPSCVDVPFNTKNDLLSSNAV